MVVWAFEVFFVFSGLTFFFCLGRRERVYPSSNDEGTERTWLEPEQRARTRVPKRSVHAINPRKRPGAKTTRHDGKAGHVMTHESPGKAKKNGK